MGSGIAQVCAQHGLRVMLFDVSTPALEAARERMANALTGLAEKNKLREDELTSIHKRLHYTDQPDHCLAGIVIEAVAEDLNLKASLLNRVAALNPPDTVLATNTSSLSVTAIAKHLQRPQQLAGMHFFNPAPVMKLVEIVRTPYTDLDAIQTLHALAIRIGKTAVDCTDAPGFIVNHVARPFYLEALWLLENESVGMQVTDRLMEATGFRMGPFALMDLIGNDINFAVSSIVYESLERPTRLKPSAIQEQKVKQGLLGRKTGQGYYDYPAR